VQVFICTFTVTCNTGSKVYDVANVSFSFELVGLEERPKKKERKTKQLNNQKGERRNSRNGRTAVSRNLVAWKPLVLGHPR